MKPMLVLAGLAPLMLAIPLVRRMLSHGWSGPLESSPLYPLNPS